MAKFKSWAAAVALYLTFGPAFATPLLVGTTTNPTGINNLVVDGTTYNLAFGLAVGNSPFIGNHRPTFFVELGRKG